MTIEQLWKTYRQGASPDSLRPSWADPDDHFYVSVLCYADGFLPEAARHARLAARHAPSCGVYREAARYLATVAEHGRQDVYISPDGFAAFIRGGGNVALYEALQHALRERYSRHQPSALIDIGAGDGLALLPSLTPDVRHVDVVEPSQAMLETAATELQRRCIPHRTLNTTLEHLTTSDVLAGERWPLAQATFSLHTVPPVPRREALRWFRERADRLLIAEFDVAPRGSCEPEWFRYVITRYEDGIAEYDGEGGLVAQGFLMPVMFGNFDPSVSHYEQPVNSWLADLRAAGFTDIEEPIRLYDYWWAPAYLLAAA